jgi:hypothetical protein
VTAIKITRFLGTAPKNSSELLPDTAAQVARNCKLYSGDLIPYPVPVIAASTGRTGEVKTLNGLRDPDTNEIKWLSWLTDVDIATVASDELNEQRFYYTGDGAPKVSTYALATAGSAPYPVANGYYELGLPLPEQTPSASADDFTTLITKSYSRSAAGTVTITTIGNHNLAEGALVTMSKFSTRAASYSRTGTLITVTLNDHGYANGTQLYLQITSGTASSNRYFITVVDANTFTCTDLVSGSTSGSAGVDLTDFNGSYTVTVTGDDTFTYYAPGHEVGTVEVSTAGLSGTFSSIIDTTSYFIDTLIGITMTITSHGFATGSFINADFTITSGSAPSNLTLDGAYSVTVVDANTLTFLISPYIVWDIPFSGTVTLFTAPAGGSVDLGSQIQARTYLYTWYTPWAEESIGSEPTDAVFIQEGQRVTLTNLPTAPPSGNNFIRGIRLYRTLGGTAESDYFRLLTLWFPNTVTAVARVANKARITTLYPHNLVEGDRVKIFDCSISAFDKDDAIVTGIVDTTVFEFASVGANVATTAATGTVYYDAAETIDKPARYWGFNGDYDFIDDFNYRNLVSILSSTEFAPPPRALKGLTVVQNNILAGFVGNDIYFSEPGKPHAWPIAYKRSIEYNIVGIEAIGNTVLVMTDGYPYIISGNSPATFSQSRLPSRYPCMSARSIVATSFGIVYASHDGLIVFSPSGGAQLLTRVVHSSDTWDTSLDVTTLNATSYKDAYFGSHSAGSIVFETGDKAGPSFVDVDFTFTSSWYDSLTNALYVTSGTTGAIYRWDDLDQTNDIMRWRSKTLITQDFTNIGAARVVADYTGTDPSTVWGLTEDTWNGDDNLWNSVDPITFNLYVNKSLIFTTTVSNSDVFRLPTGYSSDTFEVEVLSSIRVRAIHLGATPTDLRRV